jgi:beta-RFAP synthase
MSDVVVTAPARLHFGMLDPAGEGARRFGGFGAGVEHPRVVVEASACPDGVHVEGAETERAAAFAERCWARFGEPGGVRVAVREAIPSHMGLGSGTKLGLAIAAALAEVAGVPATPLGLAAASGRGARSSVGIWTFAEPGLVVEGGVRDEAGVSPLIARHPLPDAWRCVLALPQGHAGLAGSAEERAFALLRGGSGREANVSRLLLTALLPGLIDGDIKEFGAALTAIQVEVGSLFADQQGGIYHPNAAPLVAALLELGVPGVGQSSWGPAVYGIVESLDRAVAVAAELSGLGADVHVVDFDRGGARVQRQIEVP